mgnify:CR=1 FL=1
MSIMPFDRCFIGCFPLFRRTRSLEISVSDLLAARVLLDSVRMVIFRVHVCSEVVGCRRDTRVFHRSEDNKTVLFLAK